MTGPRAGAGCIIGCRKDGLGARLLLMLNCIKLGQQFDAEYFIYWPREDSLASNMEHPEKLFAPEMLDRRFLTRAAYEELGKDAVPLWKFLSDKSPDRLSAHLASGGHVLVEEGFEIVLFPWEDDQRVRTRYREFFSQIELAGVLRDRCATVDAKLEQNAAGSVAYHLRRGDILDTRPWKHTVWPSKVEPDEYYQVHLRKTPEKTAMIFSDSRASIDRLKREFPNLLAIDDIVDLDGLDQVQMDFVELYAMSRVDQIIAPTLSAYSTAAARISGRQRLRFHDVLDEDDFDSANREAVERLATAPQSYISPSEAAHAYSRVALFLTPPDRRETAEKILNGIRRMGADNAFVDIYCATNHLYQERWGDAAGHARNAAASPDIWPEDFASAKAIEAVSYASSGQRKKAGRTFREAFLFKPLRQDVVLAGTNLLLKFILNAHNFLPFDRPLLRRLFLKPHEDHSSSYLVGKVINGRPRREFRFVALDWHDLVLDGKASRLKNDKAELTRMLGRLDTLGDKVRQENGAAFTSMRSQIMAYLGDPAAIGDLEVAAEETADPLCMMRLANALSATGDDAAALNLMREVCRQSPDSPFYAHKFGTLLEQCGKRERATEMLAKAAWADNATAKMLADFAMAAMRVGQFDLAETAMQAAAARLPVYAKFKNQLQRIRDAAS